MATELPRMMRVKNKNPSSVQISAEQILFEAREHQQLEFRRIKRKIIDSSEFADYSLQKRKNFEDQIRRARWKQAVWVNYANWEESQKDFNRARSIWERALEVNYRDPSIWLKYVEFEMKHNFMNHARNVWDRAVTILPRVDQLWYKFIHMEEMLGNVAGARQIFERWMNWQPDQPGWLSYIKFELRYREVERARVIFERFVQCHSKVGAWIKYARFEMKNGDKTRVRNCYERAVEKLSDDEDVEDLFVAFAEFEEGQNEFGRARCIYKFGLDNIPRVEHLYKKFLVFEKKYGDIEDIEYSIVVKKRVEYEEEVRKNPFDYDAWFGYIHLEESLGNKQRIRELYERAIANLPPVEEKPFWQRYIYLWISYALYEEVDAQDIKRARDVYQSCIKLIPHHKFSFSKIWLLGARFEIRQLNLAGARLILGNAIGIACKDKIFKEYIGMEVQLHQVERCRKLYEQYVKWSPERCYAWIKYAEMEISLAEFDRARALFELAIDQPVLDTPELLWKAYMDFEISEGEFERARSLYERLLNRTKHVKVWISYARFEATAIRESEDVRKCLKRARQVFERALHYFQSEAPERNEERAMLLEEWLNLEGRHGESSVSAKLPKILKKRRRMEKNDPQVAYEEYTDYVFPREAQPTIFKILEAAYNWKKQKVSSPIVNVVTNS